MTQPVNKNALWTPGNGLQVRIRDEDRIKVYGCRLCGMGFPETQKPAWASHVEACAKKHEDAIQEELHERDNNILFSPMDKERWAYIQANPRKKLRRRKMQGIAGS